MTTMVSTFVPDNASLNLTSTSRQTSRRQQDLGPQASFIGTEEAR